MRLLDLTLGSPAENLALDEALLLAAENEGAPALLRFWEIVEPTVVLGSNGRVADDVRLDECRAASAAVVRRCSGGGTVVLGRGCLNFSLILHYESDPALKDIRGSYARILERTASALPVAATVRGSSDLAVAARKVSGNAQRRLSRCLLHHGTLLYDFDVGLMERFLTLPPRRPEYRLDRPHLEFAANLPADAASLRASLVRAWNASGDADVPWEAVRRLADAKYRDPEWTFRA